MNYKQEAEKIVEDFTQILSNEIGYVGAIMRIKETSIQCAIIHVEGIIDVLDKEIEYLDVRGNILLDLIRDKRLILKELKSM